MKTERRDWIILGLAVVLVISFLLYDTSPFTSWRITNPDYGVLLTYGTTEGPEDLDPMVAWDEGSFTVQDQVCEGLFGYNYSATNMEIIPRLAKDFGSWNLSGLLPIYTVQLRNDVWFHDGTKFDAHAAKWNFERLKYFMDNGMAKAVEKFRYFDVESESYRDIINKTEIVNDFELKFICNIPYGAFEALLCFNGAYMLSPPSTPATEVINTITGDLRGTGPFVFDMYAAGVAVRFHAWDYYWAPRAKVDTLIFKIMGFPTETFDALEDGTVDIITDNNAAFIECTLCGCQYYLDLNKIPSTRMLFLGINNYWINSTLRKAISYAFNGTSLNNLLFCMDWFPNESPIPFGMKFSNSSYNEPKLNITYAREIMQSMGFGADLDKNYPGLNETEWKNGAFVNFNFTYSATSSYLGQLYNSLKKQLNLIGINLTDAWTYWSPFIYCLYEIQGYHRNMLQLYWLGWTPDYNDPINFINLLFTNRTVADNGCKYNGYLAAKEAGRNPFNLWDNVQLLMEEALIETNQTIRRIYYNRIQEILIEEDMPVVFAYVEKNYDAWYKGLKGYPSNPMDKVYFYPCYWNETSLYVQ
ncbi:MAG: ABC transporter substrate-binding protein [Candidatus Lokiarchaeota archaeon]|nr:ABC transporter substrate-binding protein [Candidatus Lokiarchaeota archaeon]